MASFCDCFSWLYWLDFSNKDLLKGEKMARNKKETHLDGVGVCEVMKKNLFTHVSNYMISLVKTQNNFLYYFQ